MEKRGECVRSFYQEDPKVYLRPLSVVERRLIVAQKHALSNRNKCLLFSSM